MQKGESFEIKDQLIGTSLVHAYVTVLDTFRHHYTEETMYYIRFEAVLPITGASFVKYEVADETKMRIMLSQRVEVTE